MEDLVDRAVNLVMKQMENVASLIEIVELVYAAAKFLDEQKLAILLDAANRSDPVRQIVEFHAPRTYEKVQDELEEYDVSVFRFAYFHQGSGKDAPRQDARRQTRYNLVGNVNDDRIDGLSRQMADLSLMLMKKYSALQGSGIEGNV